MKILLVDDEPPARARARELLAGIDGVEVAGEAGDGVSALEQVAALTPDVVLLDIRMPGMDGLEAARHLGLLDAPPAIVFCTAYADHALAAFDANAIDYLLKPMREDRLRSALAKARRLAGDTLRKLDGAESGRQRTHLCAHVRGSLVLVPLPDVVYLQAEDKYTKVRHVHGTVLIEESLAALEQEFGARFARIHRSCLVAHDRIHGLERTTDGSIVVRVTGADDRLEVSRRNLSAVRRLVRAL